MVQSSSDHMRDLPAEKPETNRATSSIHGSDAIANRKAAPTPTSSDNTRIFLEPNLSPIRPTIGLPRKEPDKPSENGVANNANQMIRRSQSNCEDMRIRKGE